MPRLLTTYFGELDYAESSVYQFPHGLPGFEKEKAFVFLRQPHTEPLMFMQSLADQKLCFILLPILSADPEYVIDLDAEDCSELGFVPGCRPQLGTDILCAAIVRSADDELPEPTVNLMAPIVVNLRQRIGLQVIQPAYSHRHPLSPRQEVTQC